jgi:hypothetical protein
MRVKFSSCTAQIFGKIKKSAHMLDNIKKRWYHIFKAMKQDTLCVYRGKRKGHFGGSPYVWERESTACQPCAGNGAPRAPVTAQK